MAASQTAVAAAAAGGTGGQSAGTGQGGGGEGGGAVHPPGAVYPGSLSMFPSFPNGPHWSTGTLHQHTVRSLDRALEEAVTCGILNLSGRKLREFPGSGYDLTDTTQADLSKNRFSEIPLDVCLFAPLETLHLYHNCIKCIPETIKNLQMLTYLNISRNLLSTLPKYLFDLPLKVLVVSNNKLVSIPEEVGKLKDLMELDVSCNEIQVLPPQVGKLHLLRELNLRRNNLHLLPDELSSLPLVKLDFSCNKITEIPISYRKLRQLEVLILDNNPMQIPPAQICLKGKVHIFKFLNIHACCRTEKKPDSLDLPSVRRLASQPLTDSIEDFYPSKNHGPDSGIGSDNGDKRLSTTEPSDDDTISLHSQVSESRDQALKNDNHVLGSKLDSHKGHDQEIYDYDPSTDDTDHGDVQLTGPFVSYIKERGKLCDKSEKVVENEEWEEEQRLQKDQLLEEEEEDEIKEVTDLRKIAAQLLQQEKHNRRRPLSYRTSFSEKLFQRTRAAGRASSSSSRDHSQLSPCNWQDGEKDRINEQGWAAAECSVWQAEERRRSKQTRKEYFKYKSSRKCSSGNDNDEECERSHSNSPTPFGLKPRSAFSRSSRQEYGSLDPGFTMRRKMEHLREEREMIKQLRNNLESRLKVILPEDIGGALMDGVVLCHLANHIRPRSVASIHVPSPAVPKLSMAKCRRNVENFLDACKKLGVPQDRLCLPHHILEERGLVKVGVTVQALLELPLLRTSQLSSV
ncbi:leucine-rich repeat and calponin homology domain-containing protein 2 isoform X2 [Engystomops pustulosus]|uniref:leucine-rich repeat and calponin homology domain-containing protein 2 isoform X2 n=1 Tax=Engystomops pustulosus TaxID=76066 RepID=UPI003AFAFC67